MQHNTIRMSLSIFLAIILLSRDISAQQLTSFKNADGKYGIRNSDGKEVAPPVYENVIIDETSGLVNVRLNNKYGFIDKNGKQVTEIKYDYISTVSEGLNPLQKTLALIVVKCFLNTKAFL